MGLFQQVKVNTVYRMLFLVFQLFNTMLMSRLTGPAGFGVFSLVVVNANILLIFTSLGIPAGLLFHASARDLPLRKMEKIIWVSTLIQLGLIAVFEWVYHGLQGAYWTWPTGEMFAGLAGIAFFLSIVITEKYYALYNGFHHFHVYNLVTLLFAVLLTGTLLAMGLDRNQVNADRVIMAYILVSVVQTIILWILFHRKKIGKVTIAADDDVTKKFFSYSIYAYMANALHFLVTRVDFWILHYFRGVEELGWYALAARIAQMFLVLPALFAGIILPSVTAAQLSSSSLQKIFRMLNTLNLLLIVMLASMANWLIPLLFGADFTGTVMPLLCLLPGILFLSAQTLLASYFAGKGRPVINLYGTIIALVIVLLLDLLMIPAWGATGAAIASSLAYAAGCMYSYHQYLRAETYRWSALLVNREDRMEVLAILNRFWTERKI